MKYPASMLYRSCLLLQAAACAAFAEYTVKVLEAGPSEIRVGFSMGDTDYSIRPLDVNGVRCSRILLNDAEYTGEKGDPDVPQVSQSIVIPDRSRMDFEITSFEFKDVDANPIAPSKGMILRNVHPQDVPFEFGAAYASGRRFPQTSAYLGSPYIAGGVRANVVYFQPFQYDFKSKKLRVFTSITVRIVPSLEPGLNEKERSGKTGSVGEKTHYHPADESGGMLIVSHKNFLDAMKPFVTWKNKKGMKTELVDVAQIGDAAAIKTFVADRYRTKGTRYLLLVGDWDKVPSLTNGGPTKDDQGPSDNAYGCVEGNDAYPEMLVGRFSGKEPRDIQAQVDKTLLYERTLTAKDSWLKNGFAGSDKTETDDIAAVDYIVKDLKAFRYPAITNSISDYDASADENKLIAAVNAGIGVHFNASHGDNTSIVNLNLISVGKMTNKGRYPFNFTSACNPGTFNANADCLGEALLKKPDAGFVGAFMAAILTPWYEPYVALKEQADVLAQKYPDNIKKTYGGVAISGCMKMIDKYPKTGPWVSNALILFGDPSLQIYTDQPAPLAIAHPFEIGTGSQTIVVSGTEGATVCLYRAKAGIQEVKDLIGGTAAFPITVQPDASDTLFITGTMSNRETYEKVIAISAATAMGAKSGGKEKALLSQARFPTPAFHRMGGSRPDGKGTPAEAGLFNAQGKSLPVKTAGPGISGSTGP